MLVREKRPPGEWRIVQVTKRNFRCMLSTPGHGEGWPTHKLYAALTAGGQEPEHCEISLQGDGSLIVTTAFASKKLWHHTPEVITNFLHHSQACHQEGPRFFPTGKLLIFGSCSCLEREVESKVAKKGSYLPVVVKPIRLSATPLERCRPGPHIDS